MEKYVKSISNDTITRLLVCHLMSLRCL